MRKDTPMELHRANKARAVETRARVKRTNPALAACHEILEWAQTKSASDMTERSNEAIRLAKLAVGEQKQ